MTGQTEGTTPMAPTWPDDFIDKVICGDCLDILPLIPDGGIDAVVTDPPYGINLNVDNRHWPNSNKYEQIIGDDKPYNVKPLLRFADKPMFLWGANNYFHQLPQDWMWLIWDKTGGGTIKFMQSRNEVELCATNACGTHRIFHHYWNGFLKENEMGEPIVHPTQKPVALMRWIVSKWTKPGDIILDPYAGSGTTLVACKELDRRFIGIEISPKYCRIAEDRLCQEELFNMKDDGGE